MSVVPLPKAPQSPTAALERRLAALERAVKIAFEDDIPDTIGRLVGQTAARILDEVAIKSLIERELTIRGTMTYRGIWHDKAEYRVGDFVTHAGGGWVARADHAGQRPGSGGAAWTLAVKSG